MWSSMLQGKYCLISIPFYMGYSQLCSLLPTKTIPHKDLTTTTNFGSSENNYQINAKYLAINKIIKSQSKFQPHPSLRKNNLPSTKKHVSPFHATSTTKTYSSPELIHTSNRTSFFFPSPIHATQVPSWKRFVHIQYSVFPNV